MADETARDAVPRAVQACHELLAWLIPQLDLFIWLPRSRVGARPDAPESPVMHSPSNRWSGHRHSHAGAWEREDTPTRY